MTARRNAGLAAGVLAVYAIAQLLLPKGVPVEVLIPGAVAGALSALTAMALVLVFRSARVVNFAQANVGGFCATAVVLLVGVRGMSYWIAVPIGLVGGLLLGALIERGPLGPFRDAPRLIMTVATIGIAQFLGALTLFISGSNFSLFGWIVPNPFDVPVAAGSVVPFRLPSGWRLHVGSLVLTADYVAAAIAVPLVLVGLTWFFQRTDAGIGTRAAADSSERALLLGIPVRRLSLITWMVASFLSALGAILAAGVNGFQTNVPVGPESLIIPLVAAVIAGFDSLVVAFVASVALGLVQQTITWNYGDPSIVDLVMFALILVAMALRKRTATRVGGGDVEGFTGVREIRPLPAALARLPEVRIGKGVGLTLLLVLTAVVPLWLSSSSLTFFAFAAIFVIIGASLTLLAGWGGQISLGHFGIVGLGAGTTGWLLVDHGAPLLLCLVAAATVGTVAALVIGLPALRIRGIYLAVATLAFAAPASTFILNSSRFPALTPARIDPPLLFGRYDLSQARPFYYLCLLVALGVLGMLRNFRRSRIGRATIAVRDNERFAAAASISSVRVRLSAFALSGAIAGTAGGLYALALRGIPFGGFAPVFSLSAFTMVVVGGMGSAWGAVLGALFIYGSQYLLGPTAQLLTSGIGLLLVLRFAPGGLAALGYQARDRLLTLALARRKLNVNALFDREDDGMLQSVAAVPTETHGGLLQLEGVEAGYGHLQILFGITAGVDDGDVFALLGTNGAGKSTILKVIAGLLPERGGRVIFDGEDLAGLTPPQRVERGLVLVPGGRGIFAGLTVEENLRLGGWVARRRGDEAFLRTTTERIFTLFPVLAERRSQKAGLLSGGEQQMLTIAQALLCKPRLLMIDELSLGLAPSVVGQLLGVVRQLNEEGITIVLVEQSMNVAAEIAPKAIFLEKGQLRFAGPTAELASTETLVRSVFFANERPAAPIQAAVLGEETVLQVRGLAKSYGGVHAVRDVDLDLRAHQILGVIGANGAGKTTLFDLICGFTPADRGTVLLHGRDVGGRPPATRFHQGLGRTFQDLRLVPSLTVLETIAVALERHIDVREPVAATLGLPAALRSEASVRERAEDLVDSFNLQRYANSFVSELSTGTRRVVELAAATAHRPSVLVLDEPSSGLAQKEAEALVPVLLATRERLGAAIAIIEHDIPMIRALSDAVVCMHVGEVLATGSADSVLSDPAVISSYLGVDDVSINRSGAAADGSAKRMRVQAAATTARGAS
ncbi:MAG: ATP-binding cassette domain-containing protein [Frankiaceae bacterium]|nr:ATP-binding cassette domain-containing protein [Frankiaceae bacterium]